MPGRQQHTKEAKRYRGDNNTQGSKGCRHRRGESDRDGQGLSIPSICTGTEMFGPTSLVSGCNLARWP